MVERSPGSVPEASPGEREEDRAWRVFRVGRSRIKGVHVTSVSEDVQHTARNHGFSFVAAPNSLGDLWKAHQYRPELRAAR